MNVTRTIYLAGGYDTAERLYGVRRALVNLGYEITSRWIEQTPLAPALQGAMDYDDVHLADTVICFTDTPSTKGGYHTEVGLALGLGKRLIICGPRLNVFHHLPQVEWHPVWATLLADLAEERQ